MIASWTIEVGTGWIVAAKEEVLDMVEDIVKRKKKVCLVSE